jgi:hypothetical protein
MLTDSASELSSVSLSSSAEEKRLAPDFLVEDAPDLSFVLGGSPLLPGVPPPAYIKTLFLVNVRVAEKTLAPFCLTKNKEKLYYYMLVCCLSLTQSWLLSTSVLAAL